MNARLARRRLLRAVPAARLLTGLALLLATGLLVNV